MHTSTSYLFDFDMSDVLLIDYWAFCGELPAANYRTGRDQTNSKCGVQYHGSLANLKGTGVILMI
jgi:hypothetical protein